jgi:Protein of unknown function (DUF3313)
MLRSISVWKLSVVTALCAGLVATSVPALADKDAPAEVSQDGLHLKTQTKSRLVYVRPGATFTQYRRVAILDCAVEFSKTWLNNYNSSQRDPARRISDRDLDRAKTDLSAAFKKIFTAELSGKGGYEIAANTAPDVLVLRPALINIQVSAPDLMTPGRSTTYVQSSGQMTLYLELWDSATNTILARVMDANGDPSMYGQRSSSVSNRAAAERLMRAWAQELRKRLDIVTGKDQNP